MLQLKDIRKKYKTGELVQNALDNVSLNLRDSEFVAVLGPSGSGKTTLLNIIGGLDRYDSGDLIINGISTKKYSDRDWDAYRNHTVGFVFQNYNLIPHQTILANVELALTISGVPKAERRARAAKALEKVGLGGQLHKRPTQLSGGQMQRVAIARALVNNPDILLADEPTGALDSETSLQVMALLKDVARDRLVVMVTHNPELAEHYATRIVKLRDGKIISDSQPFEPAKDGQPEPVHRIMGRASMSLLTSLSLSFNNLLTKKARTLLTAFAGSIGIIGIALIIALSTGVNNYVDSLERAMLSAYPLQISTSGLDISALFSTGTSPEAAAASAEGKVSVYKYITKMLSGFASNDVKEFKAYLESGEGGAGTIQQNAAAIEYTYDVSPQIYRTEADGSTRKVNPDTTLSALGLGSSSSIFDSMTSMMTSGVFSQMPESEELYKPLYDIKAGRWPENANECVVALGRNGDISDYALYALGLRDSSELDSIIKQYSQSQNIDLPTDFGAYSYSDFIGISFKVVNACDYYVYDKSVGVWKDMSTDTAYMQKLVENGQELTVVGVVQPIDRTASPVLNCGVAYTPALTEQMIEQAAQSDIVKAQLAAPDTNVLTGEKFGAETAAAALDISSLITVDTDALRDAFKIDQSALDIDLTGAFDLSGLDLASLIDFDSFSFDFSALPDIDTSELLTDVSISIPAAKLDELAQKIVAGYKDYVSGVGILHMSRMGFSSYLETEEFKQLLSTSIQDIAASAELKQQLSAAAQSALEKALQSYSGELTAALQSQLQQQLASAMQKAVQQLEPQLQSAVQQNLEQLGTQIESAVTIDTAVFKNAVHTNMSEDELTALLKSLLTSGSSSYEANLTAFGYADLTAPTSINIYPRDFNDKSAIISEIEAYNASVEAQGESGKAVQYTDIVGTLMSSVTDIISVVSTILIVFVSISLVVSSIMIGVITYISVIERSKEIGILRAMGASKRNVANVFNAETFIIGLFSGVLGIVLSKLLLIPANILINYICASSGSNAEITATLPLSSSLILVLLATVLTVLSGAIPASGAAKCNPVTALRTE